MHSPGDYTKQPSLPLLVARVIIPHYSPHRYSHSGKSAMYTNDTFQSLIFTWGGVRHCSVYFEKQVGVIRKMLRMEYWKWQLDLVSTFDVAVVINCPQCQDITEKVKDKNYCTLHERCLCVSERCPLAKLTMTTISWDSTARGPCGVWTETSNVYIIYITYTGTVRCQVAYSSEWKYLFNKKPFQGIIEDKAVCTGIGSYLNKVTSKPKGFQLYIQELYRANFQSYRYNT